VPVPKALAIAYFNASKAAGPKTFFCLTVPAARERSKVNIRKAQGGLSGFVVF